MLVSAADCLDKFRCPITKAFLSIENDRLVCSGGKAGCGHEYDIIDGKPVLVNFAKSVLDKERVRLMAAESHVERTTHRGPARLIKRLLSPEKEITHQNVARLLSLLAKGEKPARVLIVGGGSIGQGMAPFYERPDIELYSFDIYASPFVQFLADAHEMPLPDDLFDAVIVQAVLEHVLDPDQVVAEIWRVLKPQGIVYADTPFMQQGHEGAYDFTRFTESGHRYLLRQFALIESGASGGPGLQLMWSVDYFVRSLFRSRSAGKLAKLAFFWAQYLDRIIPAEFAIDAASSVYFMGRKSDKTVTPAEIVDHYKGSQKAIPQD